jgi:hypothetical protein
MGPVLWVLAATGAVTAGFAAAFPRLTTASLPRPAAAA